MSTEKSSVVIFYRGHIPVAFLKTVQIPEKTR